MAIDEGPEITTPGEREVVITHTLGAPREMVWLAITSPDLLKRWLGGPAGWSMVACENDPRAGGAFRWAWRGSAGAGATVRGVYREVALHERIVRSELLELDHTPLRSEQTGTAELAGDRGRTVLTIGAVYAAGQIRDAVMAAGFKQGVAASCRKLTLLLAVGQTKA